jgi:hypothetical protein
MKIMVGVLGRVYVLVALMASAAVVGRALAAEWVNPPLPEPQTSAAPPPASPPPARKKPAHLPPSQMSVRSAAPAPAAAATSPLMGRAEDFINAYWNNIDGDEADVLGYLNSSYGARVNYYGTTKTKDAVLADKSAYMNRWPIRRTWPLAGEQNPKITCSEASSECAISGVRNFDAASPERGARATGAVRYSYTVRFGEGPPQIVSEDSAVVARR